MANFDPNQWYQLTVKSGIGVSMFGSSLFDHGLGTVFFKDTNTTIPPERWQIFSVNSSTYVLRSQDSGHNGYLAASYSGNETTPGQTRPEMRNYTLADNSMFWQIFPWGDGTFYLTNLANGTAWHLEVNPDTLMAMNSNFTTPQDGGSFSFTQLGAINNQAFSTINAPLATSTSISTGSTSIGNPTSTSSSAPTQSTITSTGSTGLTPGVSAAIGASIGVVAILLILAGLFFWFRKRKRRQRASANAENVGNQVAVEPATDPPKELPFSSPPAELMAPMQPSEHAVELYGQSRSELPGETRRNARLNTKTFYLFVMWTRRTLLLGA